MIFEKTVSGVLPPGFDAINQPTLMCEVLVDDQAHLGVSVLTGENVEVSFRFHLSRQTEGMCVGCWMTDRVMVEKVRHLPGIKT